MNHTVERIYLDVAGKHWPLAIVTPEKVVENPAIVINIAGTIEQMLEQEPYCKTGEAFLEAGHYVATFDLPNHGELIDDYGPSLIGIAAAMRDGVNKFDHITQMGRATIDLLIERGLVAADRIYLAGTSRGALSALHVTAADKRVQACAGVAPVTFLPALREWEGDQDLPMAHEASAMALLDEVTDRPLWFAINRIDQRVSTERCAEFVQAVRAAGGTAELTYLEAEGHGLAAHCYYDAGVWLLKQVQ